MGENVDVVVDDEDIRVSGDEMEDFDNDYESGELGVSCDEMEDFDDCESVQLPDKITYSINLADPLCVKLNELLSNGKIPQNGILYKYLNDVVEIFYDPFHQYDPDVLEFFNTIAYLGGRSTENFIRGPMRTGQGRHNKSNDSCFMNLGGPSRRTRSRKRSGYTTKSGIIQELSVCQLKLSTPETSFLVSNDTDQVVPCVLPNDGNALKPAIEFDNRLKRNVGLDVTVDYQFVKDNPSPSPEFLKSHIVTEVVISSVTSLDNDSSMPCVAEYVPKAGKTGENLSKSFLENIRTIQTCERCQTRAKTDEHIPLVDEIKCDSTCERCLESESVCEECLAVGHEHYLPCLRSCVECMENNQRCIRRVVLVLCADCEEGNKKAFKDIIESIVNGDIDPHLFLLTILPDAVRVGKSLKGSFANWMIVLGNERGCLGLLRTLRSRSSKAIVEKMHALLPKGDHVINRDRQDPSSVLALTSTKLTEYLSSLGYVNSTIIPEMTKFTNDNKIDSYPKPIDICVADHGFILVLFDFNEESGMSSLLRARLHCPVDQITVICKNVNAKEIHYVNGVAYLCGHKSSISVVEIIPKSICVKEGKRRTKAGYIGVLSKFSLNTDGTSAVLKKRLSDYMKSVEARYKEQHIDKNLVQFGEGYFFDSISINHVTNNELFGAVSSHKCIARIQVSLDGMGIAGQLTQCLAYDTVWGSIRSLCVSLSTIFVSHTSGVSLVDTNQFTSSTGVENCRDFEANRLASYKGGVLITDSKNRKIWQYVPTDAPTVKPFAGTGDTLHKEGLASESSFCKPCGIAVEFDHIIYVTDIDANRINIITTMSETARFLQNVGKIYSAFSIHDKGKGFEILSLPEASKLLTECVQFMRENEENIREVARCKLPSVLNGPHGNVAAKTIESLDMIKSGVNRLDEIVHDFKYQKTNLLSCLSLDCEHFHASQHFKSVVLSMQQYCVQFGSTLRESIKRISKWSAHYFTSDTSWYPVPDTAIPLECMPSMKMKPSVKLGKVEEEHMRNWAVMHGKAVRQRSNRQQTTMASSGTLPTYLYEVTSTAPVNNVAVVNDVHVPVQGEIEVLNHTENEIENDVPVQGEIETDDETEYDSDSTVHSQGSGSDTASDQEQEGNENNNWVADLGVPSLPKETLFLVGGHSRFGRAVRFNKKYV